MPAPAHPIFILDSREPFKPLAVESVEAVSAQMINPDDSAGGDVSLAALPAGGGRMNFPPQPGNYEEDLENRFGGVGYMRRVNGGGLDWHQYWLWYFYNSKLFFGLTGDHEGDWEFVQIGYAGDTPVCMTASQHQSGGSRMWWDVELRGERPVVYVALGSHANYFKRMDQPDQIGDDADGKGDVLETIAWRAFGPWEAWPGKWGNSRRVGKSPESPGGQGERWKAPHRYHSKSRAQP
jgi:hypothetical protein